MAARRVADLHDEVVLVTAFDAVALPALLTSDLRAASAFVARDLGGLASPDAAMRRLAQTLRVHLEEGQSNQRAARRLMVHPNTVGYRVRRACEVLGRDVADRQLELRIALLLSEKVPRDPFGDVHRAAAGASR